MTPLPQTERPPLATACWRRLDQPGHDSARLVERAEGRFLSGVAVWLSETGPAALSYQVELAPDWTTIADQVHGFIGKAALDRTIVRRGLDWTLNGIPQPTVAGMLDLDFQFTPATNLQQLRRLHLEIGERAECPVAWLQEGASELTVLPQTYHRLDRHRFAYEASSVGYRSTLILAEDGFARVYPDGWELEARE
ncbi:MAG TPA: putative glycolipid-binding domain-containing protein [Candidatus Synoicihabitans sp.]|nr:putative glycolipid-binding domain-containing protein [Candidatus Synoicihabitans sp.]